MISYIIAHSAHAAQSKSHFSIAIHYAQSSNSSWLLALGTVSTRDVGSCAHKTMRNDAPVAPLANALCDSISEFAAPETLFIREREKSV